MRVWRALRSEQNEASKPQRHGQRGAGRELQLSPRQGATLAPSRRRSTSRNSAMRGLCTRERISLADTTLDRATEPFPVFSQVCKDCECRKAFYFSPEETKMCNSVMQLLVIFSCGRWSQQHFNSGLPNVSSCRSSEQAALC